MRMSIYGIKSFIIFKKCMIYRFLHYRFMISLLDSQSPFEHSSPAFTQTAPYSGPFVHCCIEHVRIQKYAVQFVFARKLAIATSPKPYRYRGGEVTKLQCYIICQLCQKFRQRQSWQTLTAPIQTLPLPRCSYRDWRDDKVHQFANFAT